MIIIPKAIIIVMIAILKQKDLNLLNIVAVGFTTAEEIMLEMSIPSLPLEKTFTITSYWLERIKTRFVRSELNKMEMLGYQFVL